MTRALVLNATYEPLGVVAGRRAVVLALDGKADVLEASGEELHAAHITVPVPSVIRLRYVVRVPYRAHTSMSRRAVFVRDRHECQYCGSRADSIDHIIPRSRGGTHHWDNVVAACRPCNLRKADRLLPETSMRLLRRPSQPWPFTWLAVTAGEVPPTWQPYLGHVPQHDLAPLSA
jgi:5-methylcytosine-specific restriction endonuclease McrA